MEPNKEQQTNTKKQLNRLPSREGTTQPLSTGDNFFRKSLKGFNTAKPETNISIIKSDLFQLQEMINEKSYYIKMYKITSKSSQFTKKLTEIEESNNMKNLIDKINEDAVNIERTGKIYNTSSNKEIIQRLTLDLFHNELLLKKLSEYFLLIHLKLNGDENLYQDSYSKIFIIKLVLEKIMEKMYSTESNNANDNFEEKINVQTSDGNGMSDEILNIGSFNDLIVLHNKGSKEISHILKIINEFLNKIYSNYGDLIQKLSNKKYREHEIYSLEDFFTQKLILEKIFIDKESEITTLKEQEKINTTYSNYNPDDELLRYKSENEKLRNEKKLLLGDLARAMTDNDRLKEELRKFEEGLQSSHIDKTEILSPKEEIQNLLNIIEKSKLIFDKIRQ
jgi:hypothetical protein